MRKQPPEIEVFFSPMCDLCHRAIDYFVQRGHAVKTHEVRWRDGEWVDSPESRRMKALCGDDVDFVPQILIDGRPVHGWRQMATMIDSGELAKLLEAGLQ